MSDESLSAPSDSIVLGPLSPTNSPVGSIPATPAHSVFQEATGEELRKIFVFVNPTSGGNAAGTLVRGGLSSAQMSELKVEVLLFDIRSGEPGDKPSFQKLRREVELAKEPVICVAAGGDGTVMWMVSEIWAHGVDDSRVTIGVVPYGTGNDFARTFGWNHYNATQPFEDSCKELRNLVRDWTSAPISLHDVWEVEIEVNDGGSFKKIDGKTRKKVVIADDLKVPLTTRVFKMNNYFSIGVESRIGLGFDKRRTTSQVRNKMVYVEEGFKKMVFKNTTPVHMLVEKMAIDDGAGNEDVIFDCMAPKSIHSNLKPTKSLVAVNIPSFASGVDLWGSISGKKELSVNYPLSVPEELIQELRNIPQKVGDGKLEFVTFGSTVALGAEQVVAGNSRRLAQKGGPFSLNFRELPTAERIYFQVDGEYFMMHSPKRLEIRLFKQIRVLVHPKSANSPFFTFV